MLECGRPMGHEKCHYNFQQNFRMINREATIGIYSKDHKVRIRYNTICIKTVLNIDSFLLYNTLVSYRVP